MVKWIVIQEKHIIIIHLIISYTYGLIRNLLKCLNFAWNVRKTFGNRLESGKFKAKDGYWGFLVSLQRLERNVVAWSHVKMK